MKNNRNLSFAFQQSFFRLGIVRTTFGSALGLSNTFAFMFFSVVLSACAKIEKMEPSAYEMLSLQAWIRQHRPDLQDNYQPVGDSGYWVEVLDEGNREASSIETDAWVWYDLSVRDLHGNIVLTRLAAEARQLNTFSRYTYYVPYLHRCDKPSAAVPEGIRHSIRNPLTLEGGAKRLRLRSGSRVRLYLPSHLVGQNGLQGSNGYEGQFSLQAGRPAIATLEIVGATNEPRITEERELDAFCRNNGGLEIFDKTNNPQPKDTKDPRHPYNPASARWVSACDTVPHVYVNHRYDPTKFAKPNSSELFQYIEPYDMGFAPYDDPALERKIADALVRRFHDSKPYTDVVDSDADSVKIDGTAKIWYVGRFIDGFVFDTNIDEVKELLYERGYAKGEVFSYTPSLVEKAIKAFHYAVPHMKYGQWATLATVSVHAYGIEGKTPQFGPVAPDAPNVMSSRKPGDTSGNPDKPHQPDKKPTRATETVIPPYATLIFHLYVEPKK